MMRMMTTTMKITTKVTDTGNELLCLAEIAQMMPKKILDSSFPLQTLV
jgi:hypothetical protein